MAIVYGCQCHHVCFHYFYSGQLQIHNSIHLLYERLIIIDHHHLHSTEKGGHSLEVWTFSDFTQLSRCIGAILYGTPINDSVSFAKFLFYWNFFLFLFPSVFLLASWFQIRPKPNCLHRRPVFVVSMFTLKAEKNEKANSNNIFWI